MSTSPANLLYNSSGFNVGAFDAIFYRGTNTAGVVTIPPTPLTGNTGKLGTYTVESLDLSIPSKVVQRNNSAGADKDMALVRQAPTSNVTVQLDAASPVLLPGDCFEVVIGKDADGATDLPYARFVITSASPAFKSGEDRKQSVALMLDRHNSSANLTQF